jgi:predicted Rossmann-fold nucleotide-binding protein
MSTKSSYQFCVSGAAKGDSVEQGRRLVEDAAYAIAKAGHFLMTGATDNYDVILYTGLNYVGRDALLISSADAVISVGGRWGTLHEFAIALETQTPVGLLQGAGGASVEIEKLLDAIPLAHRKLVIIETDPDKLVDKLTALLDKQNAPYRKIYGS